MKYSQEMILKSPSGYCMPFEERDKEVDMTLGYGKQVNPKTGAEFFHHGVDFNAPHYLLSAVASGIVSGLGNDHERGLYQVIRYGDYEVKYAHLSNILAVYGDEVRAGDTVAVSDDILHMETKYKGEEFDPIEFLTMIYGNGSGAYRLPQRTEQSLRNMLMMASARNYFFEMIPSMENPMGLGRRSIPMAAKVQNLLLEDFLGYLALVHGTYLSTWDEGLKKKPTGRP